MGNCEKIKKFVNSIAYIVWSFSLWMLSYYQFLEVDFESIRNGYLKAFWFFTMSAIILYDNSISELTYEILKSCFILAGSTILNMYYNHNGNIENLFQQLSVLFIYEAFAYVIIIFLRKSEKLHGKYKKRLAFIFMVFIGITYFWLKWNFYSSLVSAVIVDVLLGYRLWLLKQNEDFMQEKKKTNFKVKYKGNKYSVNLRDKVRIERIKFVLCLKRIKRRCFILVPKNIGLYFILTLCWAIFAVFLYFIGKKYKALEIYSIKDIIWEIKSSYFTSVILALFIAGYSQNSGYKKKMELQHDFYVNVMEGFDSLLSV